MIRRGFGAVVLAALIGAAVGLVVAGLPDFDDPAPRPVGGTTLDTTEDASSASSAETVVETVPTTVAPTSSTSAPRPTSTTSPRTTTTTDPSPAGVLANVQVDVVNGGSRGGTATAVADRLNSEFETVAVAADGPSVETSYIASTPSLRRAAEVMAFLLGIDEIRAGELTGPDRLEVVLGRDYRE